MLIPRKLILLQRPVRPLNFRRGGALAVLDAVEHQTTLGVEDHVRMI
jgi:hypothetical protein